MQGRIAAEATPRKPLIRLPVRFLGFAWRLVNKKKQGATGITTVAPYIAGQWGRGE